MDNHVQELLSSYLDNELSHEERIWVESHLKTCEECQVFLYELSSMRNYIISTYQEIEIPEDLELQVMAHLNKATSSPIGLVAIASLASLSLLVLLPILLIGMGVFSSVVTIFGSLLHLATVIISSIPTVITAISAFSVVLVVFSIWSLRRLLLLKEIT
ncbi:anti-sigma factor family protein [Brevibacillus ginsengisoli]|uniref:anti-sigma factor family protein n=1 Tax=Brevibacillus ginsengisoli TaxID=363854 RepID=UPI003CE765D5